MYFWHAVTFIQGLENQDVWTYMTYHQIATADVVTVKSIGAQTKSKL